MVDIAEQRGPSKEEVVGGHADKPRHGSCGGDPLATTTRYSYSEWRANLNLYHQELDTLRLEWAKVAIESHTGAALSAQDTHDLNTTKPPSKTQPILARSDPGGVGKLAHGQIISFPADLERLLWAWPPFYPGQDVLNVRTDSVATPGKTFRTWRVSVRARGSMVRDKDDKDDKDREMLLQPVYCSWGGQLPDYCGLWIWEKGDENTPRAVHRRCMGFGACFNLGWRL
ncbi:hypothetical protein B0T24DRAFT_678809 [Lasiosphaeria ovina]|uniref:Uncharacterized protein n=1 Tax=Lasiosphaeria ovina TaxID=92902 RepID=A0AAE0KCD6_9PEZI|nr:hypothetical protein B0T24DRAFT_678809 [Lasiosphaeria ovina]